MHGMLARNAVSISFAGHDSFTLVLVATSIYAAAVPMALIGQPVTLVLVSRGIYASALAMPFASLPGPHVLAPINQPALPCECTTTDIHTLYCAVSLAPCMLAHMHRRTK